MPDLTPPQCEMVTVFLPYYIDVNNVLENVKPFMASYVLINNMHYIRVFHNTRWHITDSGRCSHTRLLELFPVTQKVITLCETREEIHNFYGRMYIPNVLNNGIRSKLIKEPCKVVYYNRNLEIYWLMELPYSYGYIKTIAKTNYWLVDDRVDDYLYLRCGQVKSNNLVIASDICDNKIINLSNRSHEHAVSQLISKLNNNEYGARVTIPINFTDTRPSNIALEMM